jgi:predicted house-cleaning noncanonical NTP pyrophosphatase (MazG superfamily)
MERYTKLVRDLIPEILDAKGIWYEKKIASDAEYREALIQKLAEEQEEFSQAGAVEELADVIEVVEALKKLPEYGDVEMVRVRKRAERGGFDKRILLTGEK